MIVQDIDRPDVNGTLPKMQAICDLTKTALAGLVPFLNITTDDNLCSGVTIRGAFEPKEQWANGIFHNAHYFIIQINPMKEKRYYDPADPKVTIEIISGQRTYRNSDNTANTFIKYTGTVEKCIERIKKWIVNGPTTKV